MKIPTKFKINREVDYHTHYIGKYKDGFQFFGYSLNKYPMYYAMVFLFNKEGDFIDSKYKVFDLSTCKSGKEFDKGKMEVWNEIEKIVHSLDGFKYGNIIVKPFKFILDGIEFGLVPTENTIELNPGSCIAFYPPWNGFYDT